MATQSLDATPPCRDLVGGSRSASGRRSRALSPPALARIASAGAANIDSSASGGGRRWPDLAAINKLERRRPANAPHLGDRSILLDGDSRWRFVAIPTRS